MESIPNFRFSLPPLSTLLAFEAAARHGSFTQAAHELRLSQSAVSHSIRQLETHLDATLFERKHRALELTRAGRVFYRDVEMGLSRIYRSVLSLKEAQAPERHVCLSVTTSFAAHWLLPRIGRFNAALPDIELSIRTNDLQPDLVNEGVGIGVRYGDTFWPGYDAWRLTEEKIFAVCSPAYHREAGPLVDAEQLLRTTLIHLEEVRRPCVDWRQWLGQVGVTSTHELPRGLRINGYAMVLQAALQGRGVALGWRSIVQPLLERQELICLFDGDLAVQTSRGFHVLVPQSRPLCPATSKVRDWLISEASRSTSGAGTDQPCLAL